MSTLNQEELELQQGIIMSYHKAKLVKQEQENKKKSKPIKKAPINQYRFIIRHPSLKNPESKEIESILKQNGCIGKYEKRDDISGSFQTKDVTLKLLKELNDGLLKDSMKVFPHNKRKRSKSSRKKKLKK